MFVGRVSCSNLDDLGAGWFASAIREDAPVDDPPWSAQATYPSATWRFNRTPWYAGEPDEDIAWAIAKPLDEEDRTMERYHSPRIAEAGELDGLSLPGEVQLALDDLAGSVRKGLLALSVGVGLKVLDELLEEELVALVGPKGKNNRSEPPTGTARVRARWCSGAQALGLASAGTHSRGARA